MKHIKLNGYLVTCVVISRKFIGLCVDNLIKKASDLHVYITKGGILIRSIYFAEVFFTRRWNFAMISILFVMTCCFT